MTGARAGAVTIGVAVCSAGLALCSLGGGGGVTTLHETPQLASASGSSPTDRGTAPTVPAIGTPSVHLLAPSSTLPRAPGPTTTIGPRSGATLPSDTPVEARTSLTRTPSAPRTVVGPLHTSGNRIYDGNNDPVELRGINRYGLERDDTTNLTSDDIAHAKQWGANFVRVALGEQLWLSNSCRFDSTYSIKVDNVVNWITSQGMVALLDLHFNTITPCGVPGQQDMADAPNSINFWEQVGARYKSNPLVAFDLYNEPNNISNSVWLDGGQVTQHGTTFQAAGMQQMYDAVRGEGANNLVFASGNDFGETFPPLLSGYNVVYANHSYTCPQVAPPNCSSPDPYDPPPPLGSWVSPSQFVPVMVTEFGWPDKDDGRYVANVIAYAEHHDWGWAVFAWDGTTTGKFDLLADVGPGSAYDPTASGKAVVSGLNTNR